MRSLPGFHQLDKLKIASLNRRKPHNKQDIFYSTQVSLPFLKCLSQWLKFFLLKKELRLYEKAKRATQIWKKESPCGAERHALLNRSSEM